MANLFKWWVIFKVVDRKEKSCVAVDVNGQFSAQNRVKSKKKSSRPRAVKLFKLGLQVEVGHLVTRGSVVRHPWYRVITTAQ